MFKKFKGHYHHTPTNKNQSKSTEWKIKQNYTQIKNMSKCIRQQQNQQQL